jgi:hypothetical protein
MRMRQQGHHMAPLPDLKIPVKRRSLDATAETRRLRDSVRILQATVLCMGERLEVLEARADLERGQRGAGEGGRSPA